MVIFSHLFFSKITRNFSCFCVPACLLPIAGDTLLPLFFWIYVYKKLITLNLVNLAKFSYTILVYCIKTNSTETNHPTIERSMDYSSDKPKLNYMLITRNHDRIDNTLKTLSYSLSIFLLSRENVHCKKTRGQIPLHSTDVHGPKSSWNGKCFLLLACVKSCSIM